MIDDKQIVRILKEEANRAVSDYSSTLSAEQQKALAYYNGDPLRGDDDEEMAFRSRVISRDVAEVVDWSVPELVRMFASRDVIAEAQPRSPEREAEATQAEALMNYIFVNENDGFERIHDQIKDGALQKIGVMRVYWDDHGESVKEELKGLTDDGVSVLLAEADSDPNHLDVKDVIDNEDGTFDVRVERMEPARAVVENIPPENFLISAAAMDEDSVPYIGSRFRKTKSELKEEGFDPKIIDSLSDENGGEGVGEETRHGQDNDVSTNSNRADDSQNTFWVYDEFARIDIDKDGKSEVLHAIRVGNTILKKEEVPEQEFVIFSPIRLTHRVIGKSLADDAMDLQEIRTSIWRESLDNLSLANAPQKIVDVNGIVEETLGDILDWRPGGIVRAKGNTAITPLQHPDITSQSLQMLEYSSTVKEERTGVSRYNQGLDADSLNHTATGITRIMEAGTARRDLTARLYANALRKVFEKLYRVICRNQKDVRRIKVNKEWIDINPVNWDAKMRFSVNVGLGTASKDLQRANAMALLNLQKEALQGGTRMVTPENLLNSMKKFTETLELGPADQFFSEPTPAPDKPDPEQQKMQAELQAKQAEMQMEMEMQAAKMQMEREMRMQEAADKLALEERRMELELALKREEMEAQIMLKQEEIRIKGETNENLRSPV